MQSLKIEVYRDDAGQKTLLLTPIDLSEMTQDVIRELMPLAEEKGLALTFKCDRAEPSDKIRADRQELRRVWMNLISNAIKFTQTGSVEVRLNDAPAPSDRAKSPDLQPEPWITLTVKDTGSGITPDEQSILFQRFRPGSRKRSGSGLGLYLSQQIVQAHQGKIEVQSTVG